MFYTTGPTNTSIIVEYARPLSVHSYSRVIYILFQYRLSNSG